MRNLYPKLFHDEIKKNIFSLANLNSFRDIKTYLSKYDSQNTIVSDSVGKELILTCKVQPSFCPIPKRAQALAANRFNSLITKIDFIVEAISFHGTSVSSIFNFISSSIVMPGSKELKPAGLEPYYAMGNSISELVLLYRKPDPIFNEFFLLYDSLSPTEKQAVPKLSLNKTEVIICGISKPAIITFLSDTSSVLVLNLDDS